MEESGWIKITDIKPHPKNSRNHDDKQIKKIAASIDKLGWGRPIIISCDNYILAGHGAYLAAQDELNLMSVPFKRMEHKHDAPEAIAYMIADNKLTDDSDWNYGKLELNFEELELEGFDLELTGFNNTELKEVETKLELNFEELELEGFDLELTGFNNTELKEVETKLEGKKEVEEDDFDPESVEENIVKSGDVWQLGNHRLMCGDSTKKEDVETLMDGNKVDLLFTSPPYNCGIDYDVHDDSMEKSEYLKLINDVITTTFTIIKEGRFVGWNVGVSPKTFHHEHLNILLKNGFKYHRQIVWVKSGVPYPVFSSSKQIRQYNPNYTHEMIYFVTKGEPIKGDSFIPKQDSEYANDVWKINQTQATRDLKTIGTHRLTGVPNDGRIHKIKEHPAPYPIKIPAGAIIHLTNKGENIIDPFGGAGSSLLAAEQLNRNCFVMEMSASYCDIIIRRWETFTQQKAKKVN